MKVAVENNVKKRNQNRTILSWMMKERLRLKLDIERPRYLLNKNIKSLNVLVNRSPNANQYTQGNALVVLLRE